MSVLKKVSNIFYGLIIVFLAVIAGLVGVSALDIPNGIRLYTVQSGSMEPAIRTGSLVIDKPQGSYGVGDVITFKSADERNNNRPKVTTTHRIDELVSLNSLTTYRTKGDANDAPDGELVSQELVIGKVIYAIPLIGFPIAFAKTREGLIMLVVIPATIIIYSEIITIKNEIIKLWQKKHEKVKVENV